MISSIIRFHVIVLLVFLTVASTVHAWVGRVVGVMDGDTIEVLHQGRGVRIRLYGVDCPQKHQDFGQRAKQFTSSKVFGTMVQVEPVDTDRYGRTVAIVFPEGSPTSLNQMLVENGFAWVYRTYCNSPQCMSWLELEQQAREARRGLWSHPNPIPPWEFRHYDGRFSSETSTPSSTGPCPCDLDLDCRDFRSQKEAQACFEHCLRLLGRDVHRLDRDGDGKACETLP